MPYFSASSWATSFLRVWEFLTKQQAFDPAYLHKSGVRQEHGAEVFEYFMSLPEVPSVIICHSDELAMGLIRAARINGVDIPGKLSVVGADNLRTGAMMLPSLATYDQHFDLMAQNLTEVALKRITDPGSPLQQIGVPMEFIPGESLKSI